MPIPKIIYQTWKTKNLSENCIKVKNHIQMLNPDYSIILYDDNDMETFIKSNFDQDIYNCYLKLNVGASKADFWRYCVLFKNGGIYLDIDSVILQPLNQLIKDDDKCIITREGNAGYFNNWIMIFEKNHPILLEAINQCCYNINNKITQDVCLLTGPWGPFTNAVNKIMIPFYNKNTNLYFENDDNLNEFLNKNTNTVKCRIYGIDMGKFAKFKHRFCNDLYKNEIYWRDEKKIFKD